MVELVDYSYDPPTPAQLRAAGKAGVIRYVSTPGHRKNLTAIERRELQDAGLTITIVCEVTPHDALGGFDWGKQRASAGLAQVVDVGGPADSVIYMTADFDVAPSEVAACLGYVQGAASALGHAKTGLYGGRRIIAAAKAANVCAYLWQTFAWSRDPETLQTVWMPGVQLQQYKNNVALGSGIVDLDRALVADYGQWGGQARPWWLEPLDAGQLAQLRAVFEGALGR
jgi:Domain of unknown function (DUF1906)